jgi:hypothetical protein
MASPLRIEFRRTCQRTNTIIPSFKSAFLVALAIVILLGLGSCGSGSGMKYSFSVNVVNDTNAPITVRYNWDQIFWTYQWFGEDTIQPNGSKAIERIEVECQGKKKLYTVGQLDTVHVSVQDFP